MNITISQIELYEFFRSKFGDTEAKNLVKLVQIETEEKFVHAKHLFATKENLKETKKELISWLIALASASTILLGGITYHFDKRFEAVDKRFESVDKRFEDFNKRFEEQTASFNKRFDEQNANFNQRFEAAERRMDRMENKLDLILEKLNSRK